MPDYGIPSRSMKNFGRDTMNCEVIHSAMTATVKLQRTFENGV
jgi:hypothetical protein